MTASAGQPARDRHAGAELLAYLPHQRSLGRLARLDLSSRELPPAGGLGGRRTAAGEHPPVAHDGGADDDTGGGGHDSRLAGVTEGPPRRGVERGVERGAPAPYRRERPRDRRPRRAPGRPGRDRRGAGRPQPPGPAYLPARRAMAAGPGGRLGLRLRPAGPRRPTLVAAGHLHVRRRLRHRGHRRQARAGGELVRQGREWRARHLRRPRQPAVPTRAAGGAGARPGRDAGAETLARARGRHRLERSPPPRRRHCSRPDDLPGRRHHAGARRPRQPRLPARPPGRAGGVVRLSLRAARPLLLPGVRRRREHPAALLLPLPRPQLGPAGARGRRVRPDRARRRGSRATTSNPTP